MQTLEIKYVGPIVSIKINLNRYNVFIGKQSSGKSTIAKIISQSLWMEKEVCTHPYIPVSEYEESYYEELVDFHNLEGYFFNPACYINYESNSISIVYTQKKCTIIRKDNTNHFLRNKILYIPAERNIVVYSDSIGGVNNLKSFATDWQSARDYHDKNNKQKILDLGVKYYQENEGGKTINRIEGVQGKEKYDIKLSNGSSGLQSVIPITTTVDFFTDEFYNPKTAEWFSKANDNFTIKKIVGYSAEKYKEGISKKSESAIRGFVDEVTNLIATHKTCFVIEEPEINLFPETQDQLMRFLVKCCDRENRQHTLTITTHSPYILSSINIMILAGVLAENDELKEQINEITGGMVISPQDIAVYAIQKGTLKSLLNKKTGLIDDNYLDSVSDILASQFNRLYDIYIQQIRNKRQ